MQSRITTQEPIMEKSECCNKVNSICQWHILGNRWMIGNNLCTWTIAYSDQRILLVQLATLPDFQVVSCQEKHPHIGMQLQRMLCFTCAVLWVTISKATRHTLQVGKDHGHLKAMIWVKSRAIQHQSNPILFFIFTYLQAEQWRGGADCDTDDEYQCHLQCQN